MSEPKSVQIPLFDFEGREEVVITVEYPPKPDIFVAGTKFGNNRKFQIHLMKDGSFVGKEVRNA